MAADPERRYRTAAELERSLRRALARPWIALAGLIVFSLVAIGAIAPRLVPAAPPVIASFEVVQFRGNPPASIGPIGLSPRSILVDDDLRVTAQLNPPGYAHLIALNSDGKVQFCLPPGQSETPLRSTEVVFPDDPSTYFGLTDGPGLQAFVVVASRRPLPPSSRWKAGLEQRWQSAAADGIWRYDGHRFSLVSRPRGELRQRSGPPAPFREACGYLAALPEVEAIQAVAFQVKPRE